MYGLDMGWHGVALGRLFLLSGGNLLDTYTYFCVKDVDGILSIFQTILAVSLVIVVLHVFVIGNQYLTIRGGALSEELDLNSWLAQNLTKVQLTAIEEQ